MGTPTPRIGLYKPAQLEPAWTSGLVDGFDVADARLTLSGSGDPNGVVPGHWIGQQYFETVTNTFWYCTTATGVASSSVWETDALDVSPFPAVKTPLSTSSGVTKDFLAIPAGARRISLGFDGVAVSSTTSIIVQIGASSGLLTSGYKGSAASVNDAGDTFSQGNSNGFRVTATSVSGIQYSGLAELVLVSEESHLWGFKSTVGVEAVDDVNHVGGGVRTLGAPLTQVRVTLANGIGPFSAGQLGCLLSDR